jgi:O-antigen ligase
MVILITAFTVLIIDRSCILEFRQHAWANFDESKRDVGPLEYGSNLTAAYLALFAMFFWGFLQFIKAKKYRLIGYGLVALTLYATMYQFSRGGYLSVLASVLVLGVLKDRKLLVILGVFLLTWQLILPTAVRERVTMTKSANGQLEGSAQTRLDLWKESWESFGHSPLVGNGYGTYQFGQHEGNLTDTHDWFIKVLVETGVVGMILYLVLLQQMFALAFRLFRRGKDPMYRGLGLGLFLALCSAMISNCFGDRWSYLEVTGPLFVLVAAAVRANQLAAEEPLAEPSPVDSNAPAVANFA